MADQPEPLTLVLAGSEIPLRPQTSKRGNIYYAVLAIDDDGNRFNSPYGVQIKPLADELPRIALVEDEVINMEERDDSGRRLIGTTSLKVKEETYTATVKVTRRKDDDWQLTAYAHKAGSGDAERRDSGEALDPSEL